MREFPWLKQTTVQRNASTVHSLVSGLTFAQIFGVGSRKVLLLSVFSFVSSMELFGLVGLRIEMLRMPFAA